MSQMVQSFANANFIRCIATLLVFSITVFTSSIAASASDNAPARFSGSLLLGNVTLIDQPDGTETVVVNIVIRDRKLDLVTEDDIPLDTVELALDARNGVLLGQLELGESPSFLVLDGDPRENFDLLLETGRHARFAVKDGEIVRNRLLRLRDTGKPPKRQGWFAYTPQPYALATTYRDPTAWNRWDGKAVSGVFAGVVVLDGMRWISQGGANQQQMGELDEYDGSELRALEFGAVGTLNFKKPWIYTIFAADNTFDEGFDTHEDDDLTFRDVRLDIPVYRDITLSVGKQKEPISLERISSLLRLPYQERSVAADALLSSRNIGVMLSGTGLDRRVTWSGGVFNDWMDDEGSISSNATQVIGRVTWLPFVTDNEDTLLHLGFGTRYSNAREGFQYQTKPEFNQSPIFVDTGHLETDQAITYDLEAYWQTGPFWLGGEYVHTDLDAPSLGDPTFTGYHITASWILSGEKRTYNRRNGVFTPVPIARSVKQNGWGAWETFARFSTVDLSDQRVDGGEVDVYSLGLTWWMDSTSNVSANYRYIDLDHSGLDGTAHGLNIRLVIMLE